MSGKPFILTPQERTFLQAERCKRGDHALTTTFTPGEQQCACGFRLYCSVCTPEYFLTHPSITAYPYECSRHREVKA